MYTLMGPPRTKDEKLVVKDETELVRDFRMPRPERGPFAGRVVRADDLSQGVAGARVEVVAASLSRSYHPLVTADSEGRFRLERSLDPITICVLSPDGSLGAIVERGADDPGAIIAVSPTATATGLLLDEKGKPAAKQPLSWGRRVYLDPEKRVMSDHFAPKVVTDESGRFTLPSLVVGQDYHIAVMRENQFIMAGMARPKKPGPMDLGTLQVGAFKPIPEEVAEAESSFEKDAPDAGAVAPAIEATTLDGEPLTLEQFKGKFVLLDFWATWCGPCIKEIPTLQAVHREFGDDERFAMVSLSVDEKIDEPRTFQSKRQLPWTQGFLGGGIHGPTPGRFGIRAIPAVVLVGPDGRIVRGACAARRSRRRSPKRWRSSRWLRPWDSKRSCWRTPAADRLAGSWTDEASRIRGFHRSERNSPTVSIATHAPQTGRAATAQVAATGPKKVVPILGSPAISMTPWNIEGIREYQRGQGPNSGFGSRPRSWVSLLTPHACRDAAEGCRAHRHPSEVSGWVRPDPPRLARLQILRRAICLFPSHRP